MYTRCKQTRVVPTLLFLVLIAGQPALSQSVDNDNISATLDSLHSKASQADFAEYFDLYSDRAIFLGTDATERWTLNEFKDYTRPHFDQGNGWTYHPVERYIYVSPGGSTAWFDETLDNASLGSTRGTGVLEKIDGVWKISQYNLTIPIPNEIALDVVQQIRALDE
ncbi:MAG: nuclear transport factor 2 family protein [Rhodothermales bacterium]|nr:nuclear transport factor 2 family protein [Rhodothermales bacterium]